MSAAEETTSAKNGNSSALINAAIWIFVVSGFSIATSILYVFGLSTCFNFQFQSYFGIRDYLEVTPYWLGPTSGSVFLLVFLFCCIKLLKDGGEFRLKREPGERLRCWIIHLITPVLFILVAVLLVIVSLLYFNWAGIYAASCVFGMPVSLYWYLNHKVSEHALGSWVEKIRRHPVLWRCITLITSLSLYALFLGGVWEPFTFWKTPISTIHLAGSNSEVRGRVLFSLTQYLIFAERENEVVVVVAIPVAKVVRIETPINQPIGSKPSPTLTPLPMSTPTPTAIVSPPGKNSLSVSATPSPLLSPVPTPTHTPGVTPPHP